MLRNVYALAVLVLLSSRSYADYGPIWGSKTILLAVDNRYAYNAIAFSATPTNAAMNYQDIYSVSIANGSDVDVTFEFESGRTFNPYVDDNSANAYIYPYAYNGGDYFMGGVDNLPSGLYSVTITGPEEEFSAFWADAY